MEHQQFASFEVSESSPYYDPSDEMPDMLRAWELDSSFRSVTRAAIGIEHHGELDLMTLRNDANRLVSISDTASPGMSSYPCSLSTTIKSSSPPLSPPPHRPCHLMRTHIELTLSDSLTLSHVIDTVNQALQSCSDYDFSYENGHHLWRGKYLQGSHSCLIHLQLYCELNPSNTFIIEAVRVSGDAKPFYDFFRNFKSALSDAQPSSTVNAPSPANGCQRTTPSCSLSSCSRSDSSSDSGRGCSPTDFAQSLEPILKMAQSPFLEVKLEAARMLCDLSVHGSSLIAVPGCLSRILHCLEQLILHDYFACVREQAIIAMAAYSEIPGFGEEMSQRGPVLAMLLALVDNPPAQDQAYASAQVRREAARIVLAAMQTCTEPDDLLPSPTSPSAFATDAMEGEPLRSPAVGSLVRQGFPVRQWSEEVAAEIRDGRLREMAHRIATVLTCGGGGGDGMNSSG